LVTAEYDFTLPVSPAEAFRLLSDPVMDPGWQGACVAARRLDGPAAAGSRHEVTFSLFGKAMTFTVLLTRYEPGVRSAFAATGGPFRYAGGYEYAAAPDGGTSVHWFLGVDPGSTFGLMPAALLKKMLIAQVKKDVARLTARLAAGDLVTPAGRTRRRGRQEGPDRQSRPPRRRARPAGSARHRARPVRR
jgi:uncharacterized protein